MLAVVRQEVARREARALDGRAPHAGDGGKSMTYVMGLDLGDRYSYASTVAG